MTLVDSHAHLADLKLQTDLDQVLLRAKNSGITHLVQGGVNPEDWNRQLQIKAQADQMGLKIATCFGIHPYTVADMNGDENLLQQMLDQLAKMLPKANAIGELGLDFRPKIAKGFEALQHQAFTEQLELAVVAEKPIVFHIVRAHEEVLRTLQHWPLPKAGGMIHSFNGSGKQAGDFLQLGLYISVGGPACRSDNKRLHQAIEIIPMDRLLIESDSPDQAPPNWPMAHNEPSSILQVADQVAKIKKISTQQVLDFTTQNARKLFHL